MAIFKRLIVALLALVFVQACSDSKNNLDNKASNLNNVPPQDALAKVNDSYILLADIELIKRRTLGKNPPLSGELKEKLTESAIKSRAMAILFEKELSERDKQKLEQQVAAYKEELLVKGYLQQHTVAEPITNQMIKEYYQKNLHEFGQETSKKVQMLRAVSQKENFVQMTNLLKKIADSDNWQETSKRIVKQEGLKDGVVSVKTFEHRLGLLGNEIDRLIARTPLNEKTGIHISGDTLYVFKVNEEQKTSAKPLSQVSSEIRKRLIPQVLAKAVEQATRDIESKVSIERYESKANSISH